MSDTTEVTAEQTSENQEKLQNLEGQALRERLQKYMEDTGVTINNVARGANISSAALSQWIREIYPSNAKKIEVNVAKFLLREITKKASPKEIIPFLKLSPSQRFYDVAKICHHEGEIGVIIGEAGIGKTMSAKQYARENPDVILIEADLGYTAKHLFNELHKKIGLSGEESIHVMLNDLIEKLKNSGRFIIIDEAENLPYKALDLIRRVYDKANIGLLLVGMPRLLYNLRGRKGEYAQLYSRVAIAERIFGFTRHDVIVILKEMLPDYEDIKLRGIASYFFKKCGGSDINNANGRALEKMLLRSKQVARLNKISIDNEIIEQVSKMLIK